MMTILFVSPGQQPKKVTIDGTLAAMQHTVGGPIQAVYPFEEPVALICHEEGKLLHLPLNRALRSPDTGGIYDIIAGNFFLCAAPPDSEVLQEPHSQPTGEVRPNLPHPGDVSLRPRRQYHCPAAARLILRLFGLYIITVKASG